MFASELESAAQDTADQLETAEAALDAALAEDVGFTDSREAASRIAALERLRRKTVALALDCQQELERSGVYGEDGHASGKIMVRHVARLSNAEAAGRDKQARMCRSLPDLAEALAEGAVGVAQFDLLGRVHANPRVRGLMFDAQEWFLECARELSFQEFEVAVREWERLADLDGAAQANQRNHERRNATMMQNQIDLSFRLQGNYAALQGASIDDIFAHYIAAERLADWEKAKAEHGDKATEAHLPRTEQQRRADAMWQICQDAASADGTAVPPEFCHAIVWDAETFETMLAQLDPDEPDTPADLDVDSYRCETLDGVPLEPLEAASTSLVSKMRRVVVNAAGTVIDLGRARRFTGSARKAAQLSARHCRWKGCAVPSSQCEIDHTHEHSKGGQTNQDNAGPFCGRHNRLKQKGFTVWRDPTGNWHTYRPDGTQIE